MTESPAPRQPVWDLPTRLFHWTLAALIGFSWWSAEEEQLDLHIWSGFAILTLLLFRLLWGVFGSSTARFSNFVRGPAAVLAYLRDMRGWTGDRPHAARSAERRGDACAARRASRDRPVQRRQGRAGRGPLAPLVSVATSPKPRRAARADCFNVLLVLIGLHIAAVLFYRLVLRQEADRADDQRPRRARPGGPADAPRQMAGSRCSAWSPRSRSPAGSSPARRRSALDRDRPQGHIALMLIRTEQTPNPATRKFLPGQTVMEAGTRDFADADSAAGLAAGQRPVRQRHGRRRVLRPRLRLGDRRARRSLGRPGADGARNPARPFRQRRAVVRARHARPASTSPATRLRSRTTPPTPRSSTRSRS